MARIRSTHPTQWTDEDFVKCSPYARLLAIGLRNEADDQGVFEWKPITIKIRLMPVDNVEIDELLTELVENRQVKRFEHGGKSYGAIRNFRVFQRPQKPNALYPLPDDLRNYVGLADADTVPVQYQYDTSTVKPPQMEDVGCRSKEGGNSKPPVSPPRDYPKDFKEFWEAYPSRGNHANPKKPAFDRWRKITKAGTPPEQILSGAMAYAVAMKKTDRDGTEFVAQASTWLNQNRWLDDYGPPQDNPGLSEWVEAHKNWRNGGRQGPEPKKSDYLGKEGE